MKRLIMTMIIEASHSNDQSNVSEDHSPLIVNINISLGSLRIVPLQADSQADYNLVNQILSAKLKRHPR